MSDNDFTLLCCGAITFSLMGIGAVLGYAWGHHLGSMHENKRVPRGTPEVGVQLRDTLRKI